MSHHESRDRRKKHYDSSSEEERKCRKKYDNKHHDDKRKRKHKSESSCEEDKSSHSDRKDKKHHKKRRHESSSSKDDKKDSKCERSKSRSRSRSKSCSKKSKSKSKSESCSRRSKSRSKSRSRSKSPDKCCNYFKHKLIYDDELQAAGADAYGAAYSTVEQAVLLSANVLFDSNKLLKNIDHKPGSGQLYVRKAGLYFISFSSGFTEPSQLTLFINDTPKLDATRNAIGGSGQNRLRYIAKLEDNSVIELKNYISDSGTLHTAQSEGGLIIGTNAYIVIVKIGPYKPEEKWCEFCIPDELEEKFCRCYKHLLRDKDLMLKGSDAFASAYSVAVSYDIPVDSPVTFNNNDLVYNMYHLNGSGDITVLENGIYFVVFMIETSQASQFTITVNGVPDLTTTTGVNKGASQILLRTLMNLKKNDVVSVVNHISAIGNVTVGAVKGGNEPGVTSQFDLFKVAPEYGKECKVEYEEHDYELYRKFKQYLLRKENVMITGSKAYLRAFCTEPQTLNNDEPVVWQFNTIRKDIKHIQGTPEICIEEDGVYNLGITLQADKPSQFAISVNGIVDAATVVGTDSGAHALTITHILELKCGDKLLVINHKSAQSPVTLSGNLGSLPGINARINMFQISTIKCEKKKDK